HVALVVVRTLTVNSAFVMTASAREVGRSWVIRSGQSTVRNAIAVYVGVPLKAPEPFEVFRSENLPAVEFLFRILERISHPVVHAQIQIAHHKDRCLEAFSKVKGVVAHAEAFFNAGRKQNDVFRITVRAVDHRQDIGLLRSRRQSRTWTYTSDVEDYYRD